MLTDPDCPFVHSADAPLRVDAQRTFGLFRGDGAHCRRLVRTRHMAGEVTHCRKSAKERDTVRRLQTGGKLEKNICWTSSPDSPSQVQPWRMSPTMREVQRLHLVGVLKVFTTN